MDTTPQERKEQITRELQALDAEHRDRPLTPEASARWQELERELDTVEEALCGEQEAVR
jgi:hypothetical protein